ncbi:MAG: dihydroorotate dehydrogenase electron transfer subunit [Candidatus Woykebacteria bacterium]
MRPKPAKVTKIVKENYRINTIFLDEKTKSEPGKFAMLWLPGFNEKPFAIINDEPLTFTIAAVGPFSKKIASLKVGDNIWYRGPYGASFNLEKKKNILLVGGGYGVAAMYDLAKKAKGKDIKSTVIIGAKNKDDVIFEQLLRNQKIETHIATEDGSSGFKGLATQLAKTIIEKEKINQIYSAGPEKMMKVIGDLADEFDVPYQLSVERFMKCGGLYLCGHCEINGYLCCIDGPVFDWRLIKTLPDFGVYHRGQDATKVLVEKFL